MHYVIDGYNMFFRLKYDDDDLQHQRDIMLEDLYKKVAVTGLDVSIVFDAAFHLGERSRSYLDELEILFTGEGETADDYILDALQSTFHPEQTIVVTSDRILARRARSYLAHTETVEEFISKLNRSYKNKLRQRTQQKPASPAVLKPSAPAPPPSKRSKTLSLEAYTDYYAQLFEARWQSLLEEEKKEASLKRIKRKFRRRKHSRNPSQNHDL
jgi:uncharacterized protein